VAADIGAGYFAFGGRIVNAHGRSPFAIEPASDAWARQLAGFGWLRHLRAADTPGRRRQARQLVQNFLAAHARPAHDPAWRPAVAARRTLSWLSQSPVILDGADAAFYRAFMQTLETHRAHLERQLSGGLRGIDRLIVALALTEFGLCAQNATALQKRGAGPLPDEIEAQILPDGGHVSRNPQALIDLLLDLLPLRQAYGARGIQAPTQLLNAIDRMMPMLRLFRHGDGTLALFNGMGLTAPELVATILAYDDARARPTTNARYAGYQRLEAGSTVVIVDSGATPPADFSRHAHAGCLSFEFSSSINRIVINCGTAEGLRGSAAEAARKTAAHSTLVIDDTSSCRFASSGALKRWLGDEILEGPSVVTAERTHSNETTRIDMSHNGYVAPFGLVHHRWLALADDGTRLDGCDRLEAARRAVNAVPYVLRFHLHPRVRARTTGADSPIRLDASDGDSWIFESDAPAGIEPSVLFAAPGGLRPTSQITIATNSGMRQQVRWSFRRLAL
jgi:uncharacterized heparinase superfamily protein